MLPLFVRRELYGGIGNDARHSSGISTPQTKKAIGLNAGNDKSHCLLERVSLGAGNCAEKRTIVSLSDVYYK